MVSPTYAPRAIGGNAVWDAQTTRRRRRYRRFRHYPRMRNGKQRTTPRRRHSRPIRMRSRDPSQVAGRSCGDAARRADPVTSRIGHPSAGNTIVTLPSTNWIAGRRRRALTLWSEQVQLLRRRWQHSGRPGSQSLYRKTCGDRKHLAGCAPTPSVRLWPRRTKDSLTTTRKGRRPSTHGVTLLFARKLCGQRVRQRRGSLRRDHRGRCRRWCGHCVRTLPSGACYRERGMLRYGPIKHQRRRRGKVVRNPSPREGSICCKLPAVETVRSSPWSRALKPARVRRRRREPSVNGAGCRRTSSCTD